MEAAGQGPVILETHGGVGRIGDACYGEVLAGCVFEKDPAKSGILARKRPTWAVYECDCETAIRGGVGDYLEVTLLDVDPHGDPWPVIEAFFASDRPRATVLRVAVNDGLRQKVKMGGAWSAGTLEQMVQRYGNQLFSRYVEVCCELMKEKAALAGYRLDGWRGYYCGHAKQMTHYAATLSLTGGTGMR